VTRALYSIMVCVIVMLAVPVSQLQLESTRVECCCPDQSKCKCPDHDKDVPTQATMKACHKTVTFLASTSVPAFPMPADPAVDEPARAAMHVAFATSQPHEPPSPARARGPS
jgi:hypothetical protein